MYQPGSVFLVGVDDAQKPRTPMPSNNVVSAPVLLRLGVGRRLVDVNDGPSISPGSPVLLRTGIGRRLVADVNVGGSMSSGSSTSDRGITTGDWVFGVAAARNVFSSLPSLARD